MCRQHPPGLCLSPPTRCPRRGERWGRILAFPCSEEAEPLCVLTPAWELVAFRHMGDGWGEGQAFLTSGDDQRLVQLRPL